MPLMPPGAGERTESVLCVLAAAKIRESEKGE
jgi:hypothetical protein